MEVSMDGLRKQLLYNYNSLVRKLNSNIRDKPWDSHVIVETDSIQREMDNIRDCIITLAFTYQEGEGGWKEMDENTIFGTFNPTENE